MAIVVVVVESSGEKHSDFNDGDSQTMVTSKREGIKRLLKGIETGDPASVTVVNEARYVQHNPMTAEGSIGLAELFKRLAATSPRVVLMRMFEDGDYVFGHVEYDFAEVVTGFEVFRFEDGYAVEHWDNLQLKQHEPNPSGINRELDVLEQFVVGGDHYVEHNPHRSDGVESLRAVLAGLSPTGQPILEYQHCHRILAEGCFVLSACEGSFHGTHSALYDNNENGKF